MMRGRIHPFLAWLCLICFGLANTAFAGGVVCNDGHGGSRIEWGGCEQNADGECAVSCANEPGDAGASAPCEDTLLACVEQIRSGSRVTGEMVMPAATFAALPVKWGQAPAVTRLAWRTSDPERPPDVLRHVRSIVLLV
jgi:hypothetical protein